MSTILVGNVEKDYFEKQPSEKLSFSVDFTEDLGSGVTVVDYSVHAVDSSGTSVDTTVLSGYSESGGVLTVGVKGGISGNIYTLTSRVTAAQTLPSGVSKMYEADIDMRVGEK
jgi:hypothetical protein